MRKLSGVILLAFFASTAFAGPKLRNVKGTVTDHNHETLAGARIEVKGTDIVVYSDFDGEFVIDQLEPGSYDLTISLVSFQELEVKKLQLSVKHADELSFELTSR